MSRINAIDPAEATGKAKQLLTAVQAKLGFAPNLMRTMAHSPAALEGYLSFSGALGHGVLDAKLREKLAIAVAQMNSCEYCLSAHTAIGGMVGIAAEDLATSRHAHSAEPKHDAALQFARKVVIQHGEVSDEDLTLLRQAGFTDAETVEIVAHVGLNIFTNYFNNVVRTVVDFPRVPLALEQAA